MYSKFGKRSIDITGAGLGLLLISPIMLIVTILVRLKLGSPIIFSQERPGYQSKSFMMSKFRTMTDKRSENGELLPDSDRLTPFGKFLRSTSLDELPGLFNVLKGEMSLVGPRPLLVSYLAKYTPEQARRHDVKPGITGWAQVNGRNAISWEEKFKLDVWYVENQSLRLDLKILLMTIKKVLVREGISQVNQATMTPFEGSPTEK